MKLRRSHLRKANRYSALTPGDGESTTVPEGVTVTSLLSNDKPPDGGGSSGNPEGILFSTRRRRKYRKFKIKNTSILSKGKFAGDDPAVPAINSSLGIPNRRRNLRTLSKGRREYLRRLSCKSKVSEHLVKKLQRLIVGLVAKLDWIHEDLRGYFRYSSRGYVVFHRRPPRRLVTTILNIVMNCRTSAEDLFFSRLPPL